MSPRASRSQRSRRSGRLLLPLATVTALVSASCRTHHDDWAFAVTRDVYGHDGPGIEFHAHSHCGEGAEAAALVFLAILVLPVAIDVVLLPVTLTHDLCDS